MNLRVSLLVVLALAAAACSPGGGSPKPGPTILPGPTGGGTFGPAELRLILIDQLGPLWYCDRDSYPVPRDEGQAALEAWPEMQAENELFRAIATRLGIDVDADVSDAEVLAIYRQWKVGLAVQLDEIGEGAYRFDYLAQPVGNAAEGTRTAGTIRSSGEITIEQQAPAGEPMCPICLARGTLIDTPAGPVPVERLALGDPIWTLTTDGRRVAGSVIALGSTDAPPGHVVVRLVLADGRAITASPGHPLADGRLIGGLRPGDTVDGSRVSAAIREPYASTETFDLVSSGETGVYLAGGIPLGSTLVPR
jgi:Hint domain